MIRCVKDPDADRGRDCYLGLPGTPNVISPELISVTGPLWCCIKNTLRRTWRIRATPKLMVNGMHQILADAPRIGLSHVRGRWDDQSQRLAIHLVVIVPMPRPVHGKVVGPDLRHSIWVASSCMILLRGGDRRGYQANGEDDSMDHIGLIHQGVLDRVSGNSRADFCLNTCELTRNPQQVPVNIARCLTNGWIVVGSSSPVHATAAVIMPMKRF